MIVPAIPRYLTEEEVAALRPGDVHHVDSGMGGSFRVRFAGHEGSQFSFDNISDGWENHGPFRYTYDEVRQHVYDLIAENPAFRTNRTGRPS
jgi:hypothetical protein